MKVQPNVIDPYLTEEIPGIGGQLKAEAADFVVEEIPAYEPAGEGEHVFLWVERTDVAPDLLLRQIARNLGVHRDDLGTAGLKDRRAVARHYVSVPRPPQRPAETLLALSGPGWKVLRSVPHRHKLRTGHLKGNRFSVLVRGTAADALERAEAIAGRIRAKGCPNYYGEQRFGRNNETLQWGRDLLLGTKTPRDIPPDRRRFLLRLAVSSVQSALFNQLLAERLEARTWDRVEVGDVMEVRASGGQFVCTDAAADQERYDRGEISVTGPMFGPRMLRPSGEPAVRECSVLARFLGPGPTTVAEADAEAYDRALEPFRRFPQLTPGTRRSLRIWLDGLEIRPEADGLRFEFVLPAGAYATVVLREFMKADAEPASPRDPAG
jgi:tRNA pseudouridine13 synthase